MCRSHLSWWARHHPLAFIQAGARIRNIGRPILETVAFAHGDDVDTFCLAMADIRGGRGCDTLLAVPIRIPDMNVIADWHEANGLTDEAMVLRTSTTWGSQQRLF